MKTATTELDFQPLAKSKDCVAKLVLNRPEKANAMSGEMIKDLNKSLLTVQAKDNCRALLLKARGRFFSAGADLKWMQAAKDLEPSANQRDAALLFDTLSALQGLKIPTLAIVQGSAFGGSLGFIAACDISIATTECLFSLREVRVGLVPAVILPFLRAKVSRSGLSYAALSGRDLSAADAQALGLVTVTVAANNLESTTEEVLSQLLKASPNAISTFKSLMASLDKESDSLEHKQLCSAAIAELRASNEGQEGLRAFFANRSPSWVRQLR